MKVDLKFRINHSKLNQTVNIYSVSAMDTIFESGACDFVGDVEAAVEDEGLVINEDNFDMIGYEESPEMLEAGKIL